MGSDEVNGYVAAIEDSDISDEQIGRGVAGVLALRAMDAALYAALLASISGSRKETVLNRLHATVRFGAGGLALRCLDREFQRSTKRAQVAATRELLNLAPEGRALAPWTRSCPGTASCCCAPAQMRWALTRRSTSSSGQRRATQCSALR